MQAKGREHPGLTEWSEGKFSLLERGMAAPSLVGADTRTPISRTSNPMLLLFLHIEDDWGRTLSLGSAQTSHTMQMMPFENSHSLVCVVCLFCVTHPCVGWLLQVGSPTWPLRVEPVC